MVSDDMARDPALRDILAAPVNSPKPRPPVLFVCQECGRKFRSVAAAEKASYEGCPSCGGCDVDLPNEKEEA